MVKRRPQKSRRASRITIRTNVERRLLIEHLGDRRVLAAITGMVFDDIDHSFRQEVAETSLAKRLVYLDTNDNGILDNSERMVIADDAGAFTFENLADGDYQVRLFNGASSQTQLFPFEPHLPTAKVEIADARSFLLSSKHSAFVLTDSTVELADLSLSKSDSISVGSGLTKMQSLPNGTLLVIGGDSTSDTAWIVNPLSSSATHVNLVSGSSPHWSDIAIDPLGRGVLLPTGDNEVQVYKVDAGSGLAVTPTEVFVPNDTSVLTSATGPRSVLAWGGENGGLEVALWSNATASMITATPIEVPGVSRLLDFDDASGLLVLRQDDGGVRVLDVNNLSGDNQFASLHSFADLKGPIKLDGARDLLFSVSPTEPLLQLFDLRNGDLIADLAIDLSTIGQVASISTFDKPDSVTVLGSAGIIEVSLARPGANRVKIEDGVAPAPIRFAMSISGDNETPTYVSIPEFSVEEDKKLIEATPGTLAGVTDDNGDDIVVVQTTGPTNGTAQIGVDGSIIYTPAPDFAGSDSITVVLHDGVTPSEPTEISITVTPVPDAPTGLSIQIDPVPELIGLGQPIGLIEVVDADGIKNHLIKIDDPRFQINNNGVVIFVGGAAGELLNFELEPFVPVTISVSDPEMGSDFDRVYSATITVADENEPITGITPTEATVYENAVGDSVVELRVLDEDTEQFHILTVDDERFTIENKKLVLADGVSLNYELTPEIIVTVSASELLAGGATPNKFAQKIRIKVLDLPEQPEVIGLSGSTLTEFQSGAVVGAVTLDGGSVPSQFTLTVDDTRFEVVNSELKLVDDQFVDRATQTEIELTITAVDTSGTFASVDGTFLIEILEDETPFHNDDNPYDVDNNNVITAADALSIINYLNVYGPGPVGAGDPAIGYDVNADGSVTALDALLILNEINRQGSVGGTVGGEQEETQPEGEEVSPVQQIALGGDANSESLEKPISHDQAILETLGDPSKKTAQRQANPYESKLFAAIAATDSPSRQSIEQLPSDIDEVIRLFADQQS